MIDVSVIIVSYNTKELLEKCLDSVVHSTENKAHRGNQTLYEIIVVDNASSDGSTEMVSNKFSKVKLIENKENFGFAKGNNIGAGVAKGEYLFFLNSDTIVENGAISKMYDFLKINSHAVGANPLILNSDGSIQKDPCYLKFPSFLSVVLYYNSFFRKAINKIFPNFFYSTNNFKTPSKISQLSGAALMIKKNVFDQVNGFDESFKHFFEDSDLSWKLRKENFERYLVPDAKIIHLGGKSLEKEGLGKKYYFNFKSLFGFCDKNYSKVKSILIKMAVIFQLSLRLRFNLIRELL